MNRNNKLLLGVLAFVVACTIGYALFSENIAITGTATAKGDFVLTTSCKTGISDFDPSILGLMGLPNEAGYENDSCTVVGDTVTFHSDLLYPTASRYFSIKVTNDGTIPALLKKDTDPDNSVILDESSKLCAEAASLGLSGCSGPDDNSIYPYWDFIFPPYEIFAFDKDGKHYTYSDNMTEEAWLIWQDELHNYEGYSSSGDIVIPPGVSVYFLAGVIYPEKVEGNGLMTFELTNKMKFNFVQQQAE